MEREDVYSLILTMAINATIEKEEDRLIQELRIFIKPHNLTLIALVKLYKINDLVTFDDNDEPCEFQGDAVVNQFAMMVSSGIETIINDNGGLTRESVEASKESVLLEYRNALLCFISAIENARDKYEETINLDQQGFYTEQYSIPVNYWTDFDDLSYVKLISLIHLFNEEMYDGFSPHEIMGEFLDDDDAEDSEEVVSHLQEYITHQQAELPSAETPSTTFEEEEPEEEEPEEEELEEEETHQMITEQENIDEINKLADDLEMPVIHNSPPCINTALPNRTEGVIDWNWMFAAVEASEDRTIESIGDKILALKNKGVIKTKQDFLDSMLFLFYATQKIDKETTQKLASMFSELR